MRNKRKLYRLAILMILAITACIGARSIERVTLADDDDVAQTKIDADFAKALTVAKENYAGQVDVERVVKSSVQGMLHTLDPHSSFLDRKEWQTFQNEQRSRYSGIGATIAQRSGKVFIMSPFDGTPAYRAGIRYGDQIVEINGESTAGLNSQQVSNKLLGPEGTSVVVKVARLGVSSPLEFKLTRAFVPLPSITNVFMLGNGVGYINLQRGFNTTTADEMSEALKILHDQGMTSLILDLRSNRGGLVDQAWKVANDFLYRGQKVVSMRGRPSVFPSRDLAASNSRPDESPLVVLINRGTASAAEIVAGALQDHDRARLVGENSFGKGLVQSVYTLKDGSGLTLTAGKYYTPSGRLIQRDYSNRSFYDYYLQRGDKAQLQLHHPEEKHTDAGRAVYGGEGIQPDDEVKVPSHEFELERVWIEPIFAFTRELTAGAMAGLAEFKIDRPADHNRQLGSSEFQISDKVVAAFKEFLKTHPELKVNADRVDKDIDFVRMWIRYEVATAAYGQEAAFEARLERDVQMQKALADIPKAKAMVDDMRRSTAAARGGAQKRD
jgi:carboxyl-terminal processing protease